MVILSGSPEGLDSPQAGAVSVGDDYSRTAEAPTSEGCEGRQCGRELLRR